MEVKLRLHLDLMGSGGAEKPPLKGFTKFGAVKVSGFTLAEVLITLGIIGIIAAMTLTAVV